MEKQRPQTGDNATTFWDDVHKLLDTKKQIIFYGSAGTGKTYLAKKVAVEYVKQLHSSLSSSQYTSIFSSLREEGRIESITFHSSYSYRDFIEDSAIDSGREHTLSRYGLYPTKPGIFKRFCTRALAYLINAHYHNEADWREIYAKYNDWSSRREITPELIKSRQFIFLIDEINRGNLHEIFGEVVSLLDADKRLGMENELVSTLPYSRDVFGIPPNVYIIGTTSSSKVMSLSDSVLRRRFGFVELRPDLGMGSDLVAHLKEKGSYDIVAESLNKLKRINERIAKDPELGREQQIGHVLFYGVRTKHDLKLVWEREILPMLEEYCGSDYRKINKLLFNIQRDSPWVSTADGIHSLHDVDAFVEMIK